ncbi:MAG: hypothetical protein U0797_01120 [Gemmataceae bacterium]
MSDDALEQPDSPRRPWRLPFGWLTLFALAWVVYELTHSPAWASALICLKFGWEDFLTAQWIWRNDPVAARRRSLGWLYNAWGAWKTAAVAFLMSVAFASVTPQRPMPQAIPQALLAFLGAFFTSLVAIGMATLATAVAVLLAWLGGVRLWLDTGVHRARRFNFWPPTPFCEGRANRLGTLVVTALGLFTFLGLLGILSVTPPGRRGAVFGLFLAVGAPIAIGLARELILAKVRAEYPDECWPEEWDHPLP